MQPTIDDDFLDEIEEMMKPTKQLDEIQTKREFTLDLLEDLLKDEPKWTHLHVVAWSNQNPSEYIKDLLIQLKRRPDTHYMHLQCAQPDSKIYHHILLLDFYTHIKIGVHDKIAVYGVFNSNWMIFQTEWNSFQNLFIYEPTLNVTPSNLSSMKYCNRKSHLQNQYTQYGRGVFKEAYFGNTGHELFQKLIFQPLIFNHLVKELSILEDLTKIRIERDIEISEFPKEYLSYIEDLYSKWLRDACYLTISKKDFLNSTLFVNFASIQWINKYILQKQIIMIPVKRNSQSKRRISDLSVQKIEERVQSNNLGMRGFIDVVLQGKIHYDDGVNMNIIQKIVNATIPLELKTGKQQENYHDQVNIYMLVLRHEFQSQSPLGMLLYLGLKTDLQIVEQSDYNLQYLINTRNQYAVDIKYAKQNVFPKFASSKYCESCDFVRICAAQKLIYDIEDLDDSHDYSEYQVFSECRDNLQTKSKAYLQHMLDLLRQEEGLFTIAHMEDQVFNQLKMQQNYGIELKSKPMIHQIAEKIIDTIQKNDKVTLREVTTNKQYECTISNLRLTKQEVVYLDEDSSSFRQDDKDQDLVWSVCFKVQFKEIIETKANTQWKIILKLDYAIRSLKSVVINLVLDKTFDRKRDLIVLGLEPEFKKPNANDVKLHALDILNSKFKQLNTNQKSAIEKCLQAKDYALITGVQQTGKTYTLCHLIYLLCYIDKKVLICTYSNRSIDKLISTLFELFPSVKTKSVRFYSNSHILPQESADIAFSYSGYTDYENVEKALSKKKLFFTTSLSQTDKFLSQDPFDYCIVDNAAQLVEPLNIANIMNSEVFILASSLRTKPRVKSSKAKNKLQVSLIERLAKLFPKANAQLNQQYQTQGDQNSSSMSGLSDY